MGYILAPVKNNLAVPIDKFLYQKLINIKIIQRAGWDCCFLVCGDERCLSGDTLLTIDKETFPVSKLSGKEVNIKSFNFGTKRNEMGKAKVIPSGKKEVYEIETEDGRKVQATLNHRFFVMKFGTILESQLKNIKIGDILFYDGVLKYNLVYYSIPTKIKSITRIGIKETFDLKVYPNHNFYLANGILSHNSGKSTLGITCGWILSQGKLTVDNIASDTTDAISKLENLPEESVLIIDEGSLMFSSKDTMRREQRQLIKILNIIGQKRMILIICLPDFFDLAKYIVHRARFLLRTYADKNLNRGRFMFWGSKRKNILYEVGKKHFNSYAYPKSNFKSRFKDFNPLGNEYIKAKERSLWSALKGDNRISNMENKHIRQRDVFVRFLYNEVRMKQADIARVLPKGLLEITGSEISRICSKSEENTTTNLKKL